VKGGGGVPPASIVVMGVSGSGKSTVGAALAAHIGVDFVDADDLHPHRNRRRMAAGVPLTDDDRWPWLDGVAATMREAGSSGQGIVIACSALRRVYRDRLTIDAGADLLFVHLTLDADALAERLDAREGHFMPAALLESQLATLEALEPDEHGLVIDGRGPVGAIVELVAAHPALDAVRPSRPASG
jgi:gluconokinase